MHTNSTKVCALVKDLEILVDGDETEIGEHGVQCFVYLLLCVLMRIAVELVGRTESSRYDRKRSVRYDQTDPVD